MKETVRNFYDQLWSSDQLVKEDVELLMMRKSSIDYSYKLLGDVSQRKLLEIGCGSGLQTIELAKKGAVVTAVDFSEKSLERLSKLSQPENIKNLTLLKMNAEEMTFWDNSFDLIYINSMLMHVNYEKVLKDCSRILKRGGKAIVIEPLRFCLSLWLYRTFFSSYRKSYPRYVTVKGLQKAGNFFTASEHEEFYFFSVLCLLFFKIFPSRAAGWIYSKVEKVDHFFLEWLPFLKPLSWITVFKYEK